MQCACPANKLAGYGSSLAALRVRVSPLTHDNPASSASSAPTSLLPFRKNLWHQAQVLTTNALHCLIVEVTYWKPAAEWGTWTVDVGRSLSLNVLMYDNLSAYEDNTLLLEIKPLPTALSHYTKIMRIYRPPSHAKDTRLGFKGWRRTGPASGCGQRCR